MLVLIRLALVEYSQMGTHVPGFQSFFGGGVTSFCIGQKIDSSSIRVNAGGQYKIMQKF